MACAECLKRRNEMINAAIEGRILQAAGHLVKGAAEMAGLKDKEPVAEEPREIIAEPVEIKAKLPKRGKRA